MKTNAVLLTLMLAGVASPALCGALDECMGKGDHPAVTACLLQEDTATAAALRQADAAAATRALELQTATGRAGPRAAFDRSVAAFRQYRDAQCNFVKAMYDSGSGADQALVACRIDLTRRRIRDLLNP
jgi:uncharacterized protein YecT (DUF1311 family)